MRRYLTFSFFAIFLTSVLHANSFVVKNDQGQVLATLFGVAHNMGTDFRKESWRLAFLVRASTLIKRCDKAYIEHKGLVSNAHIGGFMQRNAPQCLIKDQEYAFDKIFTSEEQEEILKRLRALPAGIFSEVHFKAINMLRPWFILAALSFGLDPAAKAVNEKYISELSDCIDVFIDHGIESSEKECCVLETGEDFDQVILGDIPDDSVAVEWIRHRLQRTDYQKMYDDAQQLMCKGQKECEEFCAHMHLQRPPF